jgi:hypothetical protein
MTTGAIIFMIMALAFTWGGFALCATLAIRKRDI